MAPHYSALAWKIPWTGEPGGLQSMGSQSQTRLSDFTHFILYHWRRKWHPTSVFLPEESHGQKSLAGHGPWGHRESDSTVVTDHAYIYIYIYIYIIIISRLLVEV